MITITIDPGIKRLGWAMWNTNQTLIACGLSRQDADRMPLEHRARGHASTIRAHLPTALDPAIVVVESMEAGGDRVPPQDLVDVQTVGCLTARGLSSGVVLLRPSEWKSSVPKDIHHERNRGVLTLTERQILDSDLTGVPKANRKEVLDAVGIGLYHHRRTSKSGGPRT